MPNAVNLALMKLSRRAENVSNEILVDSFVDVGTISELLMSQDHQIIYGRRGTGKTHALSYLQNKLHEAGNLSLYIDLRTIGSNSSIYSDESVAKSERVLRLLIDVGNEIYFKIQDVLLRDDILDTDIKFSKAQAYLTELEAGLSGIKVEGDVETFEETENVTSETQSSGFNLNVSPQPNFAVNTGNTSGGSIKNLNKLNQKGKIRLHVQFGLISKPIDQILTLLGKRLFILLDEWSAVPDELQPYLADMLKRSILSSRLATLKIAAIEQRSNFREQISDKTFVGFELGSDITADLDLDDYMVFDNNAAIASDFFKDLFYKHVKADAGEHIEISSADDFVRRGFTQGNAFDELVRASEGVPRDAINIAIKAAQAANNNAISVPVIRSASRKWYLQDKENTLSANPQAEQLLQYIVEEVINKRKARAFLLQQREARSNPLIQFLYDARVLHVLKRSVSAQDTPGLRFVVFKIDYGCYVELLNTTNTPKGLYDLSDDEDEKYVEVPQDDYRSIRRAILNIENFKPKATL